VLVYPVTDHDMTTASYVEHGAGALIGRQEMEWFWNHYVVDVAQRENSEVSPLRAPDVSSCRGDRGCRRVRPAARRRPRVRGIAFAPPAPT